MVFFIMERFKQRIQTRLENEFPKLTYYIRNNLKLNFYFGDQISLGVGCNNLLRYPLIMDGNKTLGEVQKISSLDLRTIISKKAILITGDGEIELIYSLEENIRKDDYKEIPFP